MKSLLPEGRIVWKSCRCMFFPARFFRPKMEDTMDLFHELCQHRIIAIMRGVPLEKALPCAKALYDGGIRLLEVTFDQRTGGRFLWVSGNASRACRPARRCRRKDLVWIKKIKALYDIKALYGFGLRGAFPDFSSYLFIFWNFFERPQGPFHIFWAFVKIHGRK